MNRIYSIAILILCMGVTAFAQLSLPRESQRQEIAQTIGDTKVDWQGAAGDDADIDQPIEQALAAANPQLREVALQLKNGSATDFQAFYNAVDTAHGSINPANLVTDAGLAILVGRPVALGGGHARA